MFFIIIVLAVIGLASLLGVTVGSVLAVAGALVLIPLLLFKLALIAAFFGFAGRALPRMRDGHRRYRRSSRNDVDERPSAEERFDEWHRLAHAKDEVDSWTPDV